jgi:PTS system mannose-specific IIC component
MNWTDFLLGALVALIAGLDRTAAFQFMVSRPIVCGPLTGWVIGQPAIGLLIGALIELLWLGRLPVGAAIPPDDTQVAVGATLLSVTMLDVFAVSSTAVVLLSLLIAMPLGKVGQFFDRRVRHRNARLVRQAEADLNEGRIAAAPHRHWKGILYFAFASLATVVVIVAAGSLIMTLLGPLVIGEVERMKSWLVLAFPLVGAAVILGTINVSRAMTLFCSSFATALLLLWLL